MADDDSTSKDPKPFQGRAYALTVFVLNSGWVVESRMVQQHALGVHLYSTPSPCLNTSS